MHPTPNKSGLFWVGALLPLVFQNQKLHALVGTPIFDLSLLHVLFGFVQEHYS